MAYAWAPALSPAPWAPRDGAGVLVLDGAAYLLGGWNPHDPVNFPTGDTCSEVWRSTDGLAWELLCVAPWEARHYGGWCVHAGRLFVVGGDTSHGHYQRDVWASTNGLDWECVTPAAPWPERTSHLVGVLGGHIYVMGGQTSTDGHAPTGREEQRMVGGSAPGEERGLADVWRSADGASWELVAEDCPWAPRGMISGSNGGLAVKDDRLWLLGGGFVGPGGQVPDSKRVLGAGLEYNPETGAGRLQCNDVWSSPDGAAWTRHLERAPWAERHYHDTAVFDGRLWVIGGYNAVAASEAEVGEEGNRSDVWCSADGEAWEEVRGTPWRPTHAGSAFVFRGELWFAPGNDIWYDTDPQSGAERAHWHAAEVWRLGRKPRL